MGERKVSYLRLTIIVKTRLEPTPRGQDVPLGVALQQAAGHVHKSNNIAVQLLSLVAGKASDCRAYPHDTMLLSSNSQKQ